MSATQTGWMSIGHGDIEAYKTKLLQWDHHQETLEKNYETYGLPSNLEELDDEQIGILQELVEHSAGGSSTMAMGKVTNIKPLSPIFEQKLLIDLYTEDCPITCESFIALLKGGRKSKVVAGKELVYRNSIFHRLVRDFIIQGGDITRGDGTGGESIYGLKFNDEKNGLKKKFEYGTLGMASGSSKNSNSSQFFICLIPPLSPPNCNSNSKSGSGSGAGSAQKDQDAKKAKEREKQLNKLNGKYVVFGRVKEESIGLLERLNSLDTTDGEGIKDRCWIEDCGVI
ncbi:uncharacterized protein I303_104314 [Kwoniella dejecticola CBS 10117]|uniref:Peptidyl-prolyl cis-trans isomerase n=1 Tax=Kwoniella dejecticola CBS 10117 TaxID=1296121 RepID=A0A1A6A5P2_9TREE|nr:uncharacterized protein I303_04712 [Kwoniella dejecticola CBS 10117]OBR85377.1 hypothetical protein I303_04712 [Kwoniella dejecticola CBS 10117]